jgi:predicted pyridoxine 5'-phosphate oxidase superfamily flavin-nucleotide-binding protein
MLCGDNPATKGLLMATLDADMRAIVERTLLCFAATTNPDGSPNLSPKSSLRVHDEGHLLFANIASPGTLRNLRRDPRIEINCVDIFARRGYRFTGRAKIHSAGDPLFVALAEAVRREHGSGIPVHDAVLVEVLEAKPVLSPAYTFIAGVTEESLRAAYARRYGLVALAAREGTE